MKTIQTKLGEILLVEVPDVWEFKISSTNYLCYKINNEWKAIPPRLDSDKQTQIIGKFSELKDEIFEEFVEKYNSDIIAGSCLKQAYRDYHPLDPWYHTSAKDSFQSLCKSQGTEDDLNNYLIIKKL